MDTFRPDLQGPSSLFGMKYLVLNATPREPRTWMRAQGSWCISFHMTLFFPTHTTAWASGRHFCLANEVHNKHNTLLSKYQGLETIRAFQVVDMQPLARKFLFYFEERKFGNTCLVSGRCGLWTWAFLTLDGAFSAASLPHYCICDTGYRAVTKRLKKEVHFSLMKQTSVAQRFSSTSHPRTSWPWSLLCPSPREEASLP